MKLFLEVINGELKSWFTSVDGTKANYKYLDTKAIEEILGLADFDVAIWLNPASRNVIAVEGVKVDKIEYYRQYDLTGGQTLQEPLTNNDTNIGNVIIQTYDNKAELKLEKVFAKITCNLIEITGGTTKVLNSQVFTNTDTITITESGTYQLVATDSYKAGMDKVSSNLSVTIVNKPMLVDGMKPVKQNTSGALVETTVDDPDWYNYDSTQKRWANVKLKDGSYYVWIPRFAYSNSGSKELIKFMKDTSNSLATDGTVLGTGYKVAPAFQNGVSNGFQNGEWDNDITGFWVAKYEATVNSNVPQSISTNSGTFTATPTNAFIYCRRMESVDTFFNITKAVTLNTSLDASVSNFGVYSTDNNNIDTHLSKNSEYGAVAFLTQSDYGNTSIALQTSAFPGYSTANNTTSTGNKSGVYGLRGSLEEITASGYSINGVFNKENVSTKYATVYTTSVLGDGVADTPISLNNSNNVRPTAANEIFIRGGNTTNGQLFGYNKIASGTVKSFRPVIIVEY